MTDKVKLLLEYLPEIKNAGFSLIYQSGQGEVGNSKTIK